jgi:hypothetical protein
MKFATKLRRATPNELPYGNFRFASALKITLLWKGADAMNAHIDPRGDSSRASDESKRVQQDDYSRNLAIPARAASTGRMFVGYSLTIIAPAIGWILEDLGATQISARMVALAVLVGGVLLTSVGNMARWGYNHAAEHHFFGV